MSPRLWGSIPIWKRLRESPQRYARTAPLISGSRGQSRSFVTGACRPTSRARAARVMPTRTRAFGSSERMLQGGTPSLSPSPTVSRSESLPASGRSRATNLRGLTGSCGSAAHVLAATTLRQTPIPGRPVRRIDLLTVRTIREHVIHPRIGRVGRVVRSGWNRHDDSLPSGERGAHLSHHCRTAWPPSGGGLVASPGSEVRHQNGKYIADDVCIDPVEGPQDRFILNTRRPLGERYSEGRLYLHVHLETRIERNGLGNMGYWCVLFHRAGKGLDYSAAEHSEVSRPSHIEKHTRERRDYRVQEAVLTNSVQFVKDPMGVFTEALPSVVRLQLLDLCLSVWIPSLDLEQPASRSGVTGLPLQLMELGGPLAMPVPENREFRSLREFVRERRRVRASERKREGVETGSEVVETVTDEHAERVAGWLFGGDIERSGAIRIRFRSDGMVLAIQPSIDLATEILQVVERPTEFQLMVERHAAGVADA
jgi:hypothetical protein